MDFIVEFFRSASEIGELRLDITLSVIINLLTLCQAGATIGQMQKVYSSRSTLGISVLTMAFYAFYFVAFLIYGIHKESLNIVLNALQFIIYIPLLVGLWMYGGDVSRRKLRVAIPAFALIPVVMLMTPWREAFLLCLLSGMLFTVWLMYRELRDIVGVGSVEIRFQLAFLVNAIFWFLYGVSINDIPLIIFNPLAIILLIMVIALYNKKKAGLHT